MHYTHIYSLPSHHIKEMLDGAIKRSSPTLQQPYLSNNHLSSSYLSSSSSSAPSHRRTVSYNSPFPPTNTANNANNANNTNTSTPTSSHHRRDSSDFFSKLTPDFFQTMDTDGSDNISIKHFTNPQELEDTLPTQISEDLFIRHLSLAGVCSPPQSNNYSWTLPSPPASPANRSGKGQYGHRGRNTTSGLTSTGSYQTTVASEYTSTTAHTATNEYGAAVGFGGSNISSMNLDPVCSHTASTGQGSSKSVYNNSNNNNNGPPAFSLSGLIQNKQVDFKTVTIEGDDVMDM